MSDVFKLQYNGMTLAYPGWNGYVAFEDAEKVYTLTLNQQTGGTISADKMSGVAGEIVTLSNTRDLGYTFNNYGITGATLTGNQFTFGDSDVTVEPSWTHNVYSVTISQKTGGTVAASPTTGYYGTQVTLSNTPAAEYNFGSYSITGATLTSNKFNFVESNVTAAGSFNQKTYTLTLQTNGHGKLVAGKTTGHKNDTTTLTPSYSSYYRFNNYSVTGGTISNNTFTFGSQNATAKANFKTNNFTATGTISVATINTNGSNASRAATGVLKAFTGSKPSNWPATNANWNVSNASAYKVNVNGNFEAWSDYYNASSGTYAIRLNGTNQVTGRIDARSKTHTKSAASISNKTTQGPVSLYISQNKWNHDSYTNHASANGTFTATGYAP